MITRDASPYSALLLENSQFSLKARYVNDVHLPRFGITPLYGTATRKQGALRGFKGFLPLEREHYTKKPRKKSRFGARVLKIGPKVKITLYRLNE